jgi:hypothetical protein
MIVLNITGPTPPAAFLQHAVRRALSAGMVFLGTAGETGEKMRPDDATKENRHARLHAPTKSPPP